MPDSFAYEDDQGSPINHDPIDSISQEDPRVEEYTARVGGEPVTVWTTRGREWLANAVDEFERVASLEENWDSYGAASVDQRTLEHAFQIYLTLMSNRHREPQIGATVNGGISLEWHIGSSGLEIEVEGPFQIHALYYNDDTGDEWEDDLKLELGPLADRLDDMGA